MAGEPQADCLFCKIVAGEIPATIVRETADHRRLPGHQPAGADPCAGHPAGALPRRAPPSRRPTRRAADVLREAGEVAAQEKVDATGYRIVFNTGRGAGQTVFHAHAHVLGGRDLQRLVGGCGRGPPCPYANSSSSAPPARCPTRQRNHNGYVLRWDGEGILFDPGEGTQRQMLHAGVAAHDLTGSASPTSTATTRWAWPG